MFYYWFWHINSRRVYQKLLWIFVFLCLFMFTLSVSCGVLYCDIFCDYLSGPILSSGYFCYFVKPLRLCQADNYAISIWLCSSLSEAYSYTCLFVNRRGTQYLFEKLHIILIFDHFLRTEAAQELKPLLVFSKVNTTVADVLKSHGIINHNIDVVIQEYSCYSNRT